VEADGEGGRDVTLGTRHLAAGCSLARRTYFFRLSPGRSCGQPPARWQVPRGLRRWFVCGSSTLSGKRWGRSPRSTRATFSARMDARGSARSRSATSATTSCRADMSRSSTSPTSPMRKAMLLATLASRVKAPSRCHARVPGSLKVGLLASRRRSATRSGTTAWPSCASSRATSNSVRPAARASATTASSARSASPPYSDNHVRRRSSAGSAFTRSTNPRGVHRAK
jgi:hypothetical protein